MLFMKDKQTDILTGWVLSLIATTVYTLTLEPTVSFWDSGEFIATAYKLQIPHPPGAPLFLLAGRLFSLVATQTEYVAFVLNLFSAICSGISIMLAYHIVILTASKIYPEDQNKWLKRGAGIIGALSFAFSDSFWYSATETEVYAFSMFFTTFVIWAMLKWDQTNDTVAASRWLILIAYVMGLSVGVHLMNLLTIPALGLIYYFKSNVNINWKGIILNQLVSILILVFILYGLVSGMNLMKGLEIYLVNQFSLPFGSGIIIFGLALIGLLVYGLYFSIQQNKTGLNTLLLSLVYLIIGYSSYSIILIRANYNPPINQNDPKDILGLIYYLNMDQYPSRPLLSGNYYTAEVIEQQKGKTYYEKGRDQYLEKDFRIEQVFDPEKTTIFPRMYSQQYAAEYQRITGIKPGVAPTFGHNLFYFVSHQLGHMYFRYFLWNFAGKESSMEGAGWLKPWDSWKQVPSLLHNDPGRNNYYLLPLLLGVFGLLYLLRYHKKMFFVIANLFVMTSLALVVYINSPPVEPRERDYIYVGSYLAFCLFMGMGVLGLYQKIAAWVHQQKWSVSLTILIALVVPALLLVENWDDHDRSERFFARDAAYNTLISCAPHSILFTGGDNDTFPLWYLQEVEGIRTDVRVIVLSYANADWYINQFYRKTYESAPLPLSLPAQAYKQGGLNDYLPLVEKPQVSSGINATSYLKLVRTEHPALQMPTRLGKLNTVPAKKFITQVEKSRVKKIVPEEMEHLIPSRLEIKLDGSGLQKNDLLILDLIDTNRWERPVYFNFTSLNSLNLDLRAHVVQEGDTFRLLPVYNPDPEQVLVNMEKMYENLIERYQYRNLDRADIPYAGYYVFFVNNYRNYFNLLASRLIDKGESAKALQTLNKSLEILPDQGVPFDLSQIRTVLLLLTLDQKEKAGSVTRILTARALEFLDFFQDQNVRHHRLEISKYLHTLNQLARIYDHFGHNPEARKLEQAFQKYYDKFEL